MCQINSEQILLDGESYMCVWIRWLELTCKEQVFKYAQKLFFKKIETDL